jgi:hypothetical protein
MGAGPDGEWAMKTLRDKVRDAVENEFKKRGNEFPFPWDVDDVINRMGNTELLDKISEYLEKKA